MPSSFTQVLSRALVFSTCLPVSVLVRFFCAYHLETFLGSGASRPSFLTELLITPQINVHPDLPRHTLYTLEQAQPIACAVSLLRHPFAAQKSTGILTCCPSTTLFSLALGADSPYADERCVGNLRLSASGNLTRFIVTHVSIRTSDISSILYKTPSQTYRTLPYHIFRYPQLRCTV